MTETNIAEIILVYFKLEEKVNKLIDDVKHEKILKEEAKEYADIYFQLCCRLESQIKSLSTLDKVTKKLNKLMITLTTYKTDIDRCYGREF